MCLGLCQEGDVCGENTTLSKNHDTYCPDRVRAVLVCHQILEVESVVVVSVKFHHLANFVRCLVRILVADGDAGDVQDFALSYWGGLSLGDELVLQVDTTSCSSNCNLIFK